MLSALEEAERRSSSGTCCGAMADSIALCPDGEAQSCAQAEAAEGC